MALPETVVDSSVVVKWFLPEPSRQEALRLLRLDRDDKIRLIAPVLLMAEVANVLSKQVRRGLTTASMAMDAYRLLKINSPILVDDRLLMDEAMTLAVGSGQAVYACLYLALALRRGCDLITADLKFHGAMKDKFPCVLHL
ncbi:MAG TPA: type II toxin-antitoxin system VapC family toxin [Bryobacteraceae bacterium]|jgi:predicted nucleic acid-binding protein|nr:type II toxin-antitoxin system VapC family toxin [Bryobacteraceae bacterium]